MSDELTREQVVAILFERIQDRYPHMGNKGKLITHDAAARARLAEQTARARNYEGLLVCAEECIAQYQASVTDITAKLATVEKERDYISGNYKQRQAWCERVEQQLAAAQAVITRLQDWRTNVTASLQREGGAFFEDVPIHIRELRAERDQLQATVTAQAEWMGRLREALELAYRLAQGFEDLTPESSSRIEQALNDTK